MSPKEWSPEDEINPEEIQKGILEFGKKFLEKTKREEEREAALQKRLAEDPPILPSGVLGFPGYITVARASFRQISECMMRAWEETLKVTLGAPEKVVESVFHELKAAALDELLNEAKTPPAK